MVRNKRATQDLDGSCDVPELWQWWSSAAAESACKACGPWRETYHKGSWRSISISCEWPPLADQPQPSDPTLPWATDGCSGCCDDCYFGGHPLRCCLWSRTESLSKTDILVLKGKIGMWCSWRLQFSNNLNSIKTVKKHLIKYRSGFWSVSMLESWADGLDWFITDILVIVWTVCQTLSMRKLQKCQRYVWVQSETPQTTADITSLDWTTLLNTINDLHLKIQNCVGSIWQHTAHLLTLISFIHKTRACSISQTLRFFCLLVFRNCGSDQS